MSNDPIQEIDDNSVQMKKKFHKTILRALGIIELILAGGGFLGIYQWRPHAPSPLDSIDPYIFSNFCVFIGGPTIIHLLWLVMILSTGIGLILLYRWAWWAEINLLVVRIIYTSFLLYSFEKISKVTPGVDLLWIEAFLFFSIGFLVYLLAVNFKDILKLIPKMIVLRVLFSIFSVIVLVSQGISLFQIGLL